MKNEKTVLWIMFGGILLIVMTPFLFTHFGFGVDFTSLNTNNIGGTIGGITAPFTGILGSILVYFALKEQVLANKLIQKQLDEQKVTDEESKVVTYLKQQLDTINKDIEEFTLVTKGKTGKVNNKITGSQALFLYLDGYLKSDIHHDLDYSKRFYQVRNIKHYIFLINDFVNSINTEKIPENDKRYLTSAIKYHFVTKVKPQFDKFENEKTSNTEICTKCGIKHYGIPDELFEIIYSIDKGLKL